MSTKIFDVRNNLVDGAFAILRFEMKHRETLKDYVRRIVTTKPDMSHVKVAKRAKKLGGDISAGYVNTVIQGLVKDPGVNSVKSLALGLGEPEDDVFEIARGKQLAEDAAYRESVFAMLYHEYSHLTKEDKRELQPIIEMLKREIQRRLQV